MFSYYLRSILGISGIVSLYGIASLGIWYLGPALGLSVTYEIIIIALLLLTLPFAILLNYFRQRRAQRRAAAAAAAEPAEPAPAQAGTAPKRIYDELARSAEEAVQWLRSTRLGGAKSREAVYGLPWFVVAGPPASGKTSLLLGSGLDFHGLPSQRRAELKIVRPTSHCEWRITDAAVLLDTSGRYQTDSPAREEWAALVELIKKYRGVRPVDGVLVAVDAQRVLRSSEAEIEQQAKTVRARLDELMQLVRMRFPVYLVFTHIDSLPGFRDFFESRSTLGSEVWGATIPLDKSVNAHALFDVEFDQLYDSLSRKRLLRLRAPAPPERQLNVFDFPLRFAEVRAKLGLLASALFRPNPFSESPLLRGFYFTASVKDGEPQGVRAPEDVSERPAQAVGHAYFSNRFFNEVLLRDKNLAASFQALQKRPPRLRSFLLAGATLVVFLLMIGAVISFFGNKALIADTLERGARADEIRRADLGKDPTKKDPAAARVEVEAVDSLREALVRLDDYDRNSPPLPLRFGLYAGNAINPSLRTIYFDSIAQRYFNPTVAGVERDLQAFVSSGESPRSVPATPGAPATSEEDVLGRNYDLLKAYLMLADPQKVEPTFLANQLQDYWKKSSPPDMETVSLQQLDFLARQAASDDAPHIRVNDRLVSEVRRKLTAYPPVNRFYKRVVTEINAKTTPVNLDSVLEGRGRGVLVGTYTVPGSFTIEGYRNYMRAAIDSAGEEISKDDWVMGTAASGAATQSTDISKLQGMYLREYTDQWRRFERGISVQQFRTKDDAVEALKVLSSTESPMERVMAEVARNTNLSAKPESRGLWGWIKGLFSRGSSDDSGGTTEVEKEFRPLFQFVSSGEAKKDSSPMSQYRAELRKVLDPLENASADQLARTSKALLTDKDDLGLQRAEQNVSNLLDGFKTAAATDTAALLKQPLNNLRAMLYGKGYEQIETAWREQVYPKAQAVESGFPFTDTGASSVTDLARFYNPTNGVFTTFFNERLATSFDDVDGRWKLKESGAFKFSDEFIKYLNDARRLRESLFPNGGQQPEVSYDLTLQPVPNTDIIIEIDGTRVETRGTSPQSAKFIWPARAGSSGAKITVVPSSAQPVERSFPGEWGLFKMFEAGSHGQAGLGQYTLSWDVGSVPVRASLRPSSANNPFARRVFTSLHAPQSVQR